MQLIIIGGGGHALSLADAVHSQGREVLGFVAPKGADSAGPAHLRWLGDDSVLTGMDRQALRLLNGLGSAGPIARRRSRYLELCRAGYRFGDVTHLQASVSRVGVSRGDATQILAGVVINAGVTLGDNVLINTGAIVEHGSRIASHSHVASGAVICGDCRIAERVHVGAGATVIQGVQIGFGAVIAAGAVVTRNVEPLTLLAGVPAREIRRIHEKELA